MNSAALRVIITRTRAPRLTNRRTNSAALYAAIPPHTPTAIVLSLSAPILSDSSQPIAVKEDRPGPISSSGYAFPPQYLPQCGELAILARLHATLERVAPVMKDKKCLR